jgi:hypothetical protein
MTVLTSEHTARKLHECARCGLAILPGERYRRHALTPRDGDIGNDVWWTQREHIDCENITVTP